MLQTTYTYRKNTPEKFFFTGNNTYEEKAEWKILYEKDNHLGNVLTVVSDRRTPVDVNTDLFIDHYEAIVHSSLDYFPFGSIMPNRSSAFNTESRYLFNGKESDSEVKGIAGTQYDYGFRIYDSRLGRFLSVDPLTSDFAWNSPYSYAENDVISSIDLEGLEKYNVSQYEVNKKSYTRMEINPADPEGKNGLVKYDDESSPRNEFRSERDRVAQAQFEERRTKVKGTAAMVYPGEPVKPQIKTPSKPKAPSHPGTKTGPAPSASSTTSTDPIFVEKKIGTIKFEIGGAKIEEGLSDLIKELKQAKKSFDSNPEGFKLNIKMGGIYDDINGEVGPGPMQGFKIHELLDQRKSVIEHAVKMVGIPLSKTNVDSRSTNTSTDIKLEYTE